MALVLRRRGDGSVHVSGEPPEIHGFAPGFIERGIAEGYVRVEVTLQTAAGPLVYELREFADDDGERNVTAWRCVRVQGEAADRG